MAMALPGIGPCGSHGPFRETTARPTDRPQETGRLRADGSSWCPALTDQVTSVVCPARCAAIWTRRRLHRLPRATMSMSWVIGHGMTRVAALMLSVRNPEDRQDSGRAGHINRHLCPRKPHVCRDCAYACPRPAAARPASGRGAGYGQYRACRAISCSRRSRPAALPSVFSSSMLRLIRGQGSVV